MKETIFRYAKSTRVKTLSVFMAFLIFSLTFTQLLGVVDLGVSITAYAADTETSTLSSISGGTKTAYTLSGTDIVSGDGTYTGQYYPGSVTLFDYLSDKELKGSDPSSIASGYYDPYTAINGAISNSGTVSSAKSNNITIKYGCSVRNPKDVYVYMQNSSNQEKTAWPGDAMYYNANTGKYEYTMKASDFTPAKVIINCKSEGNSWQTVDLTDTYSSGHSYEYNDVVISNGTDGKVSLRVYQNVLRLVNSNNHEHHLTGTVQAHIYDKDGNPRWSWGDTSSNMNPADGYWYLNDIDVSALGDELYVIIHSDKYIASGTTYNGAEQTVAYRIYKGKLNTFNKTVYDGGANSANDIKSCQYPTPLYFGAFLRGSGSIPSDYTPYNKPSYQNFYWQANIGQRTSSNTAIQGLIDNKLSSGQITQTVGANPVPLPYFDSSWNSDLIKSYSVENFPFYEIAVDAQYAKGHEDNTGRARYYQFNKDETNVYYNKTTSTLTETDTPIYAQGGSKKGFFPFNSTNDPSNNNLGFGAKFSIKFRLTPNGKTATYSGDTLTDNKVDEIFEFKGDDDVWVFIDDKLVLDLGGAHGATYGYIDFATNQVVATDTITYGTGGNDSLAQTGNAAPAKTVLNLLDGTNTWDSGSSTASYDNTEHTLTMFYMERGMFDSNLFVRFNFAAIPNRNTMTIREVTDFDSAGINPGLLAATKQAADHDVFRYTISNTGTAAGDVTPSGILAPTADTYIRNNATTYATMLSGVTTQTYSDSTVVFLDAGTWDVADAVIAAWFNIDGNPNRHLAVGTKVEIGNVQNIYKIIIPSKTITKMEFLRISPNATYTDNGSAYPSNPSPWDRKGSFSELKAGGLYKVNGELGNNTVTFDQENYTITYTPSINATANDFTPDATHLVKNVNYLWTDGQAQKTDGTDNKPLANTTDNTGSFCLMYGTDSKESSAKFIGQFKKDGGAGNNSTMTITQNNTLYKPDKTTTPATFKTTSSSAGTRTVSDYYTTRVTVEDANYNKINNTSGTSINNLSATSTEYYYANNGGNSGDLVQLTETFTNTPIVGQISIKKNALDPADEVPNEEFTFYLRLTTLFGTDVAVEDYDGITFKKYSSSDTDITPASPGNKLTAKEISGVNYGKFTLKVGERLEISGIPKDTTYTITESSDNYRIKQYTKNGGSPVASGTISGTTPNNPTDTFLVVNTRLLGTLELKKALTLNSSQKLNGSDIGDTTPFTYKVTLESPNETNYKVKLSDYISGIIKSDNTSLSWQQVGGSQYKYECTVNVSKNSPVTIVGIPYGTTYTVQETTTGPFTTTYSSNNGQTINKDNTNPTVTVTNTTPKEGNLTLTKSLQGDYSSYPNGSTQYLFSVSLTPPTGMNFNDFAYMSLPSGVIINAAGTAASGTVTLTISQLTASFSKLPSGTVYTISETSTGVFSTTYASTGGTASTNHITGTISDGTLTHTATVTNTYSDEMAPAYIKLYEHINEKLPAWGDPTFIFKITQTKDVDGAELTTPKTQIVALTVNDNGKITDTIKWYDNSNAQNFTADPINDNPYNTDPKWLVEGTTEAEYKGMYHIDSQGRIKVAPGTYEITRVPVSRYKFVTSGVSGFYEIGTEPAAVTQSTEMITITSLPAGKTVDVHYYDKVDYYDKFSHVDEEINKFYRLDASKNNTTAKGIRVEFNGKVNTSGRATIDTAQANSTSANTFNAWFINVDGTEREMTATEKANLVISDPTSQFESGNFNFIDSSKQIQISNTSNYVNKVFTLKAVYKKDTTDLFETTFDLVFARS